MKLIGKIIFTIIITTVCCSYFGQILLKIIKFSTPNYKYLILLLPLVLYFTKTIIKYFNLENVNMKMFIKNTKGDVNNVNKIFPVVLITNTLLAHLTGASVGREGVAVQLGGAIGTNFSSGLNNEQKKFLVRLGMICGFSALFQTPLAAFIFILEITVYKINKRKIYELIIFIVSGLLSSKLSHLLGLEKFFVKIDIDTITILIAIKILLGALLAIILGMIFVVLQKQIKNLAKNKFIIYFLLVSFIIFSFATNFKYSSLGTNLISDSFFNNDNITSYDFIIKLFVTAICTAVGFSGGEVTPLFSIGATFGVIFATFLGIPILLMAALAYCLVFASSTKTFITPIFLAFEVFGLQLMLIIILFSILIYFINKKYSIYS